MWRALSEAHRLAERGLRAVLAPAADPRTGDREAAAVQLRRARAAVAVARGLLETRAAGARLAMERLEAAALEELRRGREAPARATLERYVALERLAAELAERIGDLWGEEERLAGLERTAEADAALLAVRRTVEDAGAAALAAEAQAESAAAQLEGGSPVRRSDPPREGGERASPAGGDAEGAVMARLAALRERLSGCARSGAGGPGEEYVD